MLKKITLTLIISLTVLTIYFFFKGNIKYSITFGFIDLTIIVFAILVWINDRHYNEEISERIVSFPSKEMIKDVLKKQSNMLRFDKLEETEEGFKIYKGKDLVVQVTYEKDEKGNILNIDGKYVVKINGPEYVLHNIDNEIWSHIGK